MIKEVNGSILNATENAICQQVNCQGVMGSGLAKIIYEKYPDIKEQYKRFCSHYSIKKDLLGQVHYGKCKDFFILNIFGQFNYGKNPDITYTNYIALEHALQHIYTFAKNNNYSIAFPYKMGCGLANGNWTIVKKMIEDIFIDIEVTIYKI